MKERIYLQFASLFRKFRMSRGIRHDELADLLGVSEPLISFFETGRELPSPKILGRLCGMFGWNPEWVTGIILKDMFARAEVKAMKYSEVESEKIPELNELGKKWLSFFNARSVPEPFFWSLIKYAFRTREPEISDLKNRFAKLKKCEKQAATDFILSLYPDFVELPNA